MTLATWTPVEMAEMIATDLEMIESTALNFTASVLVRQALRRATELRDRMQAESERRSVLDG